MTHDTTRTAGLGFAFASAASFGLSGSLARGLMDAGWSSAAAVSVRILLAAVVLAPLAVVQLRGRWDLLRRNLPLVGVYGLLAVAGCQLAFFNAVERMPVGVALLIEYMSPVAVIGWLWLTRGQRPGPRTVAGALLAIAGLALVLDLVSGTDVDGIGIIWAFGAMVGVTAYFLISAQDAGLPPVVLAAAGLTVGAAALLALGAGRRAAVRGDDGRRALRRRQHGVVAAGAGPGRGHGRARVRHGHRRHPSAGLAARLLRRPDRSAGRTGVRLGAAGPGPAARSSCWAARSCCSAW